MATQASILVDTVRSIMSTNVQTVDCNAPVSEALRLMSEDNFNSIPVVNSDRECVGMLSSSDLSETLFAEDQKLAQLMESVVFSQLSADVFETCRDKLVREVMTLGATSVSPDTTMKKACELMAENRIHHLPVVSEQGLLEGIVSTFDIVGWLAKKQ